MLSFRHFQLITGGYNVWRHGSLNGGRIDAIMIESHKLNRLDYFRENYAYALAKAIVKFLQINYG